MKVGMAQAVKTILGTTQELRPEMLFSCLFALQKLNFLMVHKGERSSSIYILQIKNPALHLLSTQNWKLFFLNKLCTFSQSTVTIPPRTILRQFQWVHNLFLPSCKASKLKMQKSKLCQELRSVYSLWFYFHLPLTDEEWLADLSHLEVGLPSQHGALSTVIGNNKRLLWATSHKWH